MKWTKYAMSVGTVLAAVTLMVGCGSPNSSNNTANTANTANAANSADNAANESGNAAANNAIANNTSGAGPTLHTTLSLIHI